MRLSALILLLLPCLLQAQTPSPHGVVFMYHRFDENRYPSTNIRLQQFQKHLDYLQHEGFTILPLRKMVRALEEGEALPDKSVALTVDDAYRSVYEKAFPLLRSKKIPLTVFVSTDAVDQQRPDSMSWQQMRQMQQHGIDFANHGAAHLHMAKRLDGESEEAWKRRISEDILRAQRRLDEELGPRGLPLFAYPFGEYSLPLANLVEELGFIAFGQHSGAIGPCSNTQALPRFPMNEHFGVLEKFRLKASTLPLPLENREGVEPQLGSTNPPSLKLCLAAGSNLTSKQVNCYLGNGTLLKQTVQGNRSLTVYAPSPLPAGRSRYNCTAPAGNGRYHWFSQPWFNGADPADPGY